MDGNILTKRGFTLTEVSLVILIISGLACSLIFLSGKFRQVAQAQRLVGELDAIANASVEYYNQNGAWPGSVSDLRLGYLSIKVSDSNPFGNVYLITSNSQSVSVSTVLPKGLVSNKSFVVQVVVVNQSSNDLVSVTKPVITNLWKLKYEKKNIYKQ